MLSDVFYGYLKPLSAGALILGVAACALAPQRLHADTPEAQICASKSALGHDRFEKVLAEISLPASGSRSTVIELMRNKENGCRKALEVRLLELKEKPSNHKNNTGRHAVLNLGLLLEVPTALQLVEAEAAGGGGLEWLAMLEQWDPKSYASLLRGWVIRDAQGLRSKMGLLKNPLALYGKTQIEELRSAVGKNVAAPLVLELYLKSVLAQGQVASEEFAALNVHFATAHAASRRIFIQQYESLLRKNDTAWIAVFREEQPWIQFQMIELMGRVGGPEMIRELLWISQNHADARLRSRASQTLDAALKQR